MECHIIPDNVKSGMPGLNIRLSLGEISLMQCNQECYEVFGIVGVSGGDIAWNTIIGDGNTHGYVGAPLS